MFKKKKEQGAEINGSGFGTEKNTARAESRDSRVETKSRVALRPGAVSPRIPEFCRANASKGGKRVGTRAVTQGQV